MSENLLEAAVNKVTFNPTVHVATENGDPARNKDGTPERKKNWAKLAKDRQGRMFNPKTHGEEAILDNEGFLTVRRRSAKPSTMNAGRSRAFVDKYKETGYTYYICNNDGGRLEQMSANDWEQVTDKDGKSAQMEVGQARSPDTKGILLRKPTEWYEADQREKRKQNDETLKDKKTPNEAMGQYDAGEPSPLR